jgi:hypothetical protein
MGLIQRSQTSLTPIPTRFSISNLKPVKSTTDISKTCLKLNKLINSLEAEVVSFRSTKKILKDSIKVQDEAGVDLERLIN